MDKMRESEGDRRCLAKHNGGSWLLEGVILSMIEEAKQHQHQCKDIHSTKRMRKKKKRGWKDKIMSERAVLRCVALSSITASACNNLQSLSDASPFSCSLRKRKFLFPFVRWGKEFYLHRFEPRLQLKLSKIKISLALVANNNFFNKFFFALLFALLQNRARENRQI